MVLTNFIATLRNNINKVLDINKRQLDLLSQRNADLDPQKIFERGYSITMHKGQALKNSRLVRKGDIIDSRLFNGKLSSEII